MFGQSVPGRRHGSWYDERTYWVEGSGISFLVDGRVRARKSALDGVGAGAGGGASEVGGEAGADVEGDGKGNSQSGDQDEGIPDGDDGEHFMGRGSIGRNRHLYR